MTSFSQYSHQEGMWAVFLLHNSVHLKDGAASVSHLTSRKCRASTHRRGWPVDVSSQPRFKIMTDFANLTSGEVLAALNYASQTRAKPCAPTQEDRKLLKLCILFLPAWGGHIFPPPEHQWVPRREWEECLEGLHRGWSHTHWNSA